MLIWESKIEVNDKKFLKITKRIREIGEILISMCGTDPPPINKKGYEIFPDSLWCKDFKIWEYPKMFFWLKKLQEQYNRPLKIIDFGCGFSPFPQFLAENGFDVWGIDNNYRDGLYETSRPPIGINNMKKAYPDVHYHVGEIYELNDKFDAIVSLSVLEHINEKELEKIYAAIKKLLSSGKSCHIVDYYFPDKYPRMDRINFIKLVKTFNFSYDSYLCPGTVEFDFPNLLKRKKDFLFPEQKTSRILIGDDV
jgi:hypothetical protein